MSNTQVDGRGMLTFLGQVADLSARQHANPQWVYQSIAELVLDLAGPPRTAPLTLPAGVSAGEPKNCFYNAYTLAVTHSDLLYAEGFAQASILPVPHAWCVNQATGQVVDPTWANLTTAKTGTYAGLVFTTAFLVRHALKTRSSSVLESDHRNGFQALQRGFTLNGAGQVTGWGPDAG